MSERIFDALSMRDVRAWVRARNSDREPNLLDYLAGNVPVTGMMAMVDFFWPTFVEIRGCVLLPWSANPRAVDEWWSQLDGDVPRIESVLNHLHLWDVFEAEDEDAMQAFDRIGAMAVETWTQQLSGQYPQRKFHVEYRNDEQDYGPTLYVASDLNR